MHRFSTLFTAQNVREYFSSDSGLSEAIDWCKRTAVTKVYLEEFRDGYTADRATLIKARDTFRTAGIERPAPRVPRPRPRSAPPRFYM